MSGESEQPADTKCDRCKKRTAIYREKKRRRGRLTRDRYCAGCTQWAYGKYGLGPENFDKIRYE